MLKQEIYETHKVFLKACENGDSLFVKDYLKENAGTVLRDDISYEAACLAARNDHSDIYKQLNNFSHPTIYAARSANRDGALGENNECLKISNIETKKYEKIEAIKDAFDNFKIMGQFALGIAAIGVVEALKATVALASLASSSIYNHLSPSKIVNKINKVRVNASGVNEINPTKNKPD